MMSIQTSLLSVLNYRIFSLKCMLGRWLEASRKKSGQGDDGKILPKGMTRANEKPYCFVEVYAAVTNRWNWLSPVAFLRKKTGASMWKTAASLCYPATD